MIGLKNIENDSGIINCLTIMKDMPNTKENEPFTGFICWADTISKPRNRIYKSFYVCAQNDKFGEYIIHNNARLTVFFVFRLPRRRSFRSNNVLQTYHKRSETNMGRSFYWHSELNWVFKWMIELLPNIFIHTFSMFPLLELMLADNQHI